MSKLLKSKWGKLLILPLFVVGLGVGVMSVLGVFAPEIEKIEEAPRPVSLFVEAATINTRALSVTTQGEVAAQNEVSLVPQVSGRIIAIAQNFADGGSVRSGETLITIDPTDYEVALTRAQSAVQQAKTRVALAEAATEVARRNWDESVGGEPTPLALKLPQLEEARASLRAAEADLHAAEVNLARTKVSVPFEGRVRTKMAAVGQYVTPGTVLGTVFSTERVEVRLPLTDAQLASLGLGLGYENYDYTGPAVTFSAVVGGTTRQWQGNITRVDGNIDSLTRVVYAVAETRDPYGVARDGNAPLAVGLFVTASIETQNMVGELSIPREALRADNTVFVVTTANTLDIRRVKVAHTDLENAVIAEGIEAGELVVVSPVRSPRQGMAVQTIDPEENAEYKKVAEALSAGR